VSFSKDAFTATLHPARPDVLLGSGRRHSTCTE